MHIRTYIRRLGKFLQQRFSTKLNVNLFVGRWSKYVHLGLDIPLLRTRVSSELIAIIKDYEKENRDPKYLFILSRLIRTTKWKYDYIIFEIKDMYDSNQSQR